MPETYHSPRFQRLSSQPPLANSMNSTACVFNQVASDTGIQRGSETSSGWWA